MCISWLTPVLYPDSPCLESNLPMHSAKFENNPPREKHLISSNQIKNHEMLIKLVDFLTIFLLGTTAATNSTVKTTGSIREGEFRYIYDSSIPNACDTILFLAVGTAIGVSDYDKISTEIVTDKPIVTIVSDQPKILHQNLGPKIQRLLQCHGFLPPDCHPSMRQHALSHYLHCSAQRKWDGIHKRSPSTLSPTEWICRPRPLQDKLI